MSSQARGTPITASVVHGFLIRRDERLSIGPFPHGTVDVLMALNISMVVR